MQRDAFVLARDLIDVRKPLSLESALCRPFLNNISEINFTYAESEWNGINYVLFEFINMAIFYRVLFVLIPFT
jgi:hypothetical protein